MSQRDRVQILALTLNKCITSGRGFKLFEPTFYHLKNKDDWDQCLECIKYSICSTVIY